MCKREGMRACVINRVIGCSCVPLIKANVWVRERENLAAGGCMRDFMGMIQFFTP